MIKGILFDYSGTIDTNGIHWAEVIWEHYQKYQLPVSKELFLTAYRFSEQALFENCVIRPDHTFLDVMARKIDYQFQWLLKHAVDLSGFDQTTIAEDCTFFAEYTVQRSFNILQQVGKSFPMSIVSDFYGNLSAVLEAFGINQLFTEIVDSTTVGIRKPDPKLYLLGVRSLGFSPDACVVVGDSLVNDIVPAKAIGCKTIWLKDTGFVDDEEAAFSSDLADYIISDLDELNKVIARL